MLLEKITNDLVIARKANDTIKKSILLLLVGECERVSKSATDQQVESIGRKMMKDLKTMIPYGGTAQQEYDILSEYFPEIEIKDYKTVVTDLLNGFTGNPISLLGQVMKAGQGTYNIAEVKEYLASVRV